MGKLGSTDMKLVLLYMWGTCLLWESFLLYVYSLLGFYFLNESLCRLGYENAKYNFHNAKDSYHSFIYRCCCFLWYFFRCWVFFVCCPGSLALVAVRTGDPGNRFIWFPFLRGPSGVLCLAFFVSHLGSSALVTVWIGDQNDRFSWLPSLRFVYN